MDYPNFDNYWLGLNESWQDGTNTIYPTDPYEYKRNGSDESGWKYYTRLKDSGAGWDPVTRQKAIDSIEQQVTFTDGDSIDTGGTVPDDQASTGALIPRAEVHLFGSDALAKINAIQRPEWKIKLLSTLPYVIVDSIDNRYFDAMGKLMYSEANDPNSTYFGEPFTDKFTFPKTGQSGPDHTTDTSDDFDPANKPAHVLTNPFYVPSATVKPEDVAKAQEVAKEEAALPGAASKQAKIAQLRKEIREARKKSRDEDRMARKDARLDKKIQRLEDKQKAMGISNESKVYSFSEFVRSRGI